MTYDFARQSGGQVWIYSEPGSMNDRRMRDVARVGRPDLKVPPISERLKRFGPQRRRRS